MMDEEGIKFLNEYKRPHNLRKPIKDGCFDAS